MNRAVGFAYALSGAVVVTSIVGMVAATGSLPSRPPVSSSAVSMMEAPPTTQPVTLPVLTPVSTPDTRGAMTAPAPLERVVRPESVRAVTVPSTSSRIRETEHDDHHEGYRDRGSRDADGDD